MRILCRLLVLFVCAGAASAQPYTLTGRVTDADGVPLAGVNILERGTTNGTATGVDGRYVLGYGAADAVVLFSYVGFRRQAVAPAGRAELDVVMEVGDLGEIFVVGTRAPGRSATDGPVAVDALVLDEVAPAAGPFEVNQLMQVLVPSFNASRQSGADGSDHVDPASLRGLGPDQTLVLVNGRRRHQSALVNLFGSRGRGNTGTDLNTIPAAAIERIEVLRDGASAQYGSDAIAGVVNVVLKSDVDVFTGQVSGGARQARLRTDRDYDGETVQLAAHYGAALGAGGFLTLTGDYRTAARTNRPVDPNAFAVYRRQYGDAAQDNFSAFFNAGLPLAGQASLYAFGGYSRRATDAYAWTREPDSDRNVPALYPNGFDPRILSDVTDRSVSAGLRAKVRGWDVDLNDTYGVNRFHYRVDGTLNASLLERSPTRFDAGGFSLAQNTAGVHFSRFFPAARAGVNVAFGGEYRAERYRIFAGEEASWRNYGVVDSLVGGVVRPVDVLGRPGGSQGFPGFRPANELDESRTNVGVYLDAEAGLARGVLASGALRYERYSDFGGTLNAKLAARVAVATGVALRGSASTGFRAPSLAQVHFNSTFTDFVSGVAIDKLIAKNDSPITRALGIPTLRQETARNASVGVAFDAGGGLTATADAYYVAIDDRIVLTGAFGDDDPDIGADLRAQGVGAAQFFTNALDTRTRGLDVVVAYARTFGPHGLRVSVAGNVNDMTTGDVHTSPKLAGKEDVYFGRRERYFLLASAPTSKVSLRLAYDRSRTHAALQLVRFGEVTLIDFVDTEDVYAPKTTTDLSLGYDLTPAVSLVLGGANVFDVYPTPQDTETETGGLWDAVQMGFGGRFYYGRLNFRL